MVERRQMPEDKAIIREISADEWSRAAVCPGSAGEAGSPLACGSQCPQLPSTPIQDMKVSTQHGSTVPCLWLHCSYMGVGGFPGAWKSNRWKEDAPFPSQRAQSSLPAQGSACLAGCVQRHMDVLGCLQLVLGSVTALRQRDKGQSLLESLLSWH